MLWSFVLMGLQAERKTENYLEVLLGPDLCYVLKMILWSNFTVSTADESVRSSQVRSDYFRNPFNLILLVIVFFFKELSLF